MSDQNLQALLEEYAQVALYIDGEEEKLGAIKKAAANIKQAVQAKMAELGITNAKTVDGHGMSLSTSSSVKVEDAEAFFNFVFESGDDSFIRKQANVDACKAYLAEKNELPPGVKMDQVTTLRFTRAKAK